MEILTYQELKRIHRLNKLKSEFPGVIESKGFYALYATFLEIAMKADNEFESVSVDLQTTDYELAENIRTYLVYGIMERPSYPFEGFGAISVGENGNYHILITGF